MLTLVVEGRVPLLGKLKGNADASGDSPDRPMVELSELGKCIMREEIRKIHQHYPKLEVWKTCIMPDHIHMIVRVNEDMSEGRHLGHVMAGFKFGCNIAYWRIFNFSKKQRKRLFEAGYNDKILFCDEQLDNWKKYLDDNPRRLMKKEAEPWAFHGDTGIGGGWEEMPGRWKQVSARHS